jgi:peptidoglycan/LPS O-acetylase OafA/YrhL
VTRGQHSAEAAAAPTRSPGIDGLRTIAVTLVVVFHMWPTTHLIGGAVGVDVFFVISGFVITTTLLQERAATGRIRLGAFYRRRWLRLMPALALVSGTVLAIAVLFPSGVFAGQGQGAVFGLTYTMDLARGFGWGGDRALDAMGHTWSLGVEEQFYLVWPIALLGLLAAPRWLRGLLWLPLLLVPTALRLAWWSPEAFFRIYNLPDTRFDQLLVGAALACLMAAVPAARVLLAARVLFWPSVTAVAAVVLYVPMAQPDRRISALFYTVGLLAVAVAAAAIVARLALDPRAWVSRVVGWRPLATVGRRYSYGIYLWHYVVLYVVNQYPLSRPVWVTTQVVAVAVLAVLTHRFVERPALRRKRRLETPVLPAVAPAAATPGPVGPATIAFAPVRVSGMAVPQRPAARAGVPVPQGTARR